MPKFVFFLHATFFLLYATQAQQMPVDFSDPDEAFTSFSGSSFAIVADPTDADNQVGEFTNSGNTPWEGFALDLDRAIDLDFNKTVSLSFYSFDADNHTVLVKLERGEQPDVEVSQSVSGQGWTHSKVFNFADALLSSDGSTPVNASGKYNRITIFIDGGVQKAGTYLIDDIDDGSEEIDPNEIDVVYDKLVWEDNFDGNTLAEGKWHRQTQVIIPEVGWANGEYQHYTDKEENAYVADGNLVIKAIKETYADQDLTKDYTSARLNSKYAFTYGRVDVRAKIPISQGIWPAIWMLGKNINEAGGYWASQYGTTSWPACGEIDIMEYGIFHSEPDNFIGSALHSPCCFGGNPNKGGILLDNLGEDFHTYSVNWSPNQITFLVDSQAYYTYNPDVKDAATWPFDKDQFILLNVAVGGFAGDPTTNFTSDSMVIDYVRVFAESDMTAVDKLDDTEIKVYPNPTANYLNIRTSKEIQEVTLSNTLGETVLNSDWDNRTISLEDYPNGLYFLKVKSGNRVTTHRVVVRR